MSTITSPSVEARETARATAAAQKVAHLTSVHPVFDNRIFHKECRTLATAGYDVTLIGPHDRAELINGVHIEPVNKKNSRWRRMTSTVWEVYRKALRSGARVCHFHDPELLPVGVLLKLAGRRVIYDAHEHVAHDILTKHWINPQIRRLISASTGIVENLAARTFDAVIAATPAIADSFPERRRVLVQNFPQADELANGDQAPYRSRGPFILYVGSITEMKGAKEMVAALHHLDGYPTARLLLLGEIDHPALKVELHKSPGWDKVEHVGFQQRRAVTKFASRARLGLVLFHPAPNYHDSLPNKLFEYMSGGLPVVASNFPAWREIVESNGCGLVVDPMNTGEIAEAIAWLLDHPAEAEAMGKRGQAAVRSTYNWDTQAESLLGLYERVLQ